jgi:hypothetical protein
MTTTAQITDVLTVLRECRELGYTEATVSVSRGGTLTVSAKSGDGDKVRRVEWGTGRGK